MVVGHVCGRVTMINLCGDVLVGLARVAWDGIQSGSPDTGVMMMQRVIVCRPFRPFPLVDGTTAERTGFVDWGSRLYDDRARIPVIHRGLFLTSHGSLLVQLVLMAAKEQVIQYTVTTAVAFDCLNDILDELLPG